MAGEGLLKEQSNSTRAVSSPWTEFEYRLDSNFSLFPGATAVRASRRENLLLDCAFTPTVLKAEEQGMGGGQGPVRGIPGSSGLFVDSL